MEVAELYKLYIQHPVITTDSRDVPKIPCFLPERRSFRQCLAAGALERGCKYAVVDEKEYAVPGDERYILVVMC